MRSWQQASLEQPLSNIRLATKCLDAISQFLLDPPEIDAMGNADTDDALLWGWQSAPDQRGTIDILWSCLATTFLCS
jgi:hypothetical protein